MGRFNVFDNCFRIEIRFCWFANPCTALSHVPILADGPCSRVQMTESEREEKEKIPFFNLFRRIYIYFFSSTYTSSGRVLKVAFDGINLAREIVNEV